jgi:hypothetical protein
LAPLLALTVARAYVPFTEIGAAVLKMLADAEGVGLERADGEELKEKILDDAALSGSAGSVADAAR